ncbi:arylamine N-acetyltransferase [Paenibacillus pasadenensis]|uniref:arylamine N-acetyltransferase family protein n=1 Tax=Paenibacillus pasadenensis TaxID=217090 RepID=UPI00203CF3BB|nr:arylamine N-acetyltransferase [Paenibacillus pasadenensis]MCM3747068.1 arylamine N-acetyltransferase [Paenibacillus pasadenensis]
MTNRHQLNQLFRERIGWSETGKLEFSQLPSLLEAAALAFPFENLRVISGSSIPMNDESLTDKLLIRKEGGLCYELNSLLYLFLADNGFDVRMTRGIVYNHELQQWPDSGRTHIAVLLTEQGKRYLVDTGFGINHALRALPLTGEAEESRNGRFRIRQEETPYGDYVYEMMLSGKDDNWRLGYAFDSTLALTSLDEPREVQEMIERHPKSPFNKKPLAAKLTKNGSISLSPQTFTQWVDGQMTKTAINETEYAEKLRLFGL